MSICALTGSDSVALAVGIGSLQLLLDRGEQVGWFDPARSVIEAIVSVAGFYYFFAHSLTTDEPVRAVRDVQRPQFHQRLHLHDGHRCGAVRHDGAGDAIHAELAGISDPDGGLSAGSRGVGTLITMLAAPRLMQLVHPRYLILCGSLLAGGTLYYMTGFSLDVTKTTIVVTSIVQGIGLGLLFVPISTVAFATLPSSPAHGCNRHHHANPQYRLLDRHFHGDRQSNEQDDRDARAANRASHPFQ